MTKTSPFTVYVLPFTLHHPFSVFGVRRLMVNSKRKVNSKQIMANWPTVGGHSV